MLLLGVELQDVLRVVVGIALGLLTIYRRELSCNRGYHPDDENDDDPPAPVKNVQSSQHCYPLNDRGGCATSSHDDNNIQNNSSRMGLMRRRKSSSALDEERHRIPKATATAATLSLKCNNNGDATEELLESAGLSLSGGPFLYMAIAMFDHLVFTRYLSTFTSVSSALHRLKSKLDARQDVLVPTSYHNISTIPLQLKEPSSHDNSDEIIQKQQQLYSVAWNAATEYFTNISTKLDTQQHQQRHQQQQCSLIQNDPPNKSRHSTAATLRSKSTGNLQSITSDDTTTSSYSRALFREMVAMANNGGFDVTLLPSDAQIGIFSYLPPKDVLAFTCTNRAGRSLLDDGGDELAAVASSPSSGPGPTERQESITSHGLCPKNSDTPLLIWKALFHRDYSWVLMDWDVGKDAFLKSMTNFLQHRQQQGRNCPKSRKVFRHLLSSICLDSEHLTTWPIDSMADTSAASMNSIASMKEFYFTFAESWLNYTIAGCNSPTNRCLIGLHGHVFDITNFVEDHPGSTETLLLQAGRDATVFFESMGHSLGARKLALGMCVVVNGQCIQWNCIPKVGVMTVGDGDLLPKTAAVRSGRSSSHISPWGLVKPSHLASMRNKLGFLLPRKRSLPRFQGGLDRIRERLRQEEELELHRAAQWGNSVLGTNGMFGGVHVYFDPFYGWRWWYTDRDFTAVFVTPPRPS